jgi:hypothetical protein
LYSPQKFECPPFWNDRSYGIKNDGGEVTFNGMISLLIGSNIIIIIIIISCYRFSFFPGTSALEPVVNPTTQASSLSL